MKIIVTTTQALFQTGGAEFLTQNLVAALRNANHEVDIINIPTVDIPVGLVEHQIVAVRLMEIEKTWAGRSDLCIGLKFPAYYIRHSNKVLWVLHQYRAAYDLWESDLNIMHQHPDGKRIKNIVINADNTYLRETKKIYTIAENVSKRLDKYNHLDSTCLYHPCPDMEKFYCENYDDYILMPSRINITKRQMLAVEALAQTKSNIKLYIVGKAENDNNLIMLKQLIKDRNLTNRIKIFGHVSQEEKFKLYANARAVMFIPYDEDYGYITLEGMSASKPVITTTDSGGPLEFIINDKTGKIAEPNPADLARVIDELASSASYADKLGTAAKKHLRDMDITWDNVIKELTA